MRERRKHGADGETGEAEAPVRADEVHQDGR